MNLTKCLLGLLPILAATPGFGGAGQLTAAEPKRPNIVFIFSDDHGYQAVSAYNDPRKLLQTPNIDRLASRGVDPSGAAGMLAPAVAARMSDAEKVAKSSCVRCPCDR